MFGMLLEMCRIPMHVFRCPSDAREYTLTEAQFYMPFNSEINDMVQNLPFDYMVVLIGYALPNRRVPWSVARDDTTIPNRGGLDAARVRSPATKILVWDGYCSIFTYGGGASALIGWDGRNSGPLWGSTIFRHGPSRGPNCLFADGHVEPTIDWIPIKTDPPKDDLFTMPYTGS
jgi:prepilin-type processing-associated H-X9-DG protein